MRLFVDTAHKQDIERLLPLIDGVTTNPSLLFKESNESDFEGYIRSIVELCAGLPVSLEVKGGSADDMYNQAKNLLARFAYDNVVIKIPINPYMGDDLAGLSVIKKLSNENISTNVTLIFTPEQALMAARAGATYVSPFVGRIDDKIRKDHDVEFAKTDYFPSYGWKHDGATWEDHGIISGVDLIQQTRSIFDQYGFDTQILAASLRNARQVREVALVGADVATLPPKLFDELLRHPKTDEGMQGFLKQFLPEYERLM